MSNSKDIPAAEPDPNAALARALSWHSTAPIRIDQAGSPAHGAIMHGLDRKQGSPLGVYTEITGYSISLNVFLLRARRDQRFLRGAMDSGDYLVRIQTAEGAYPDLPDPANPLSPVRLFSFDTAMCIAGMARLASAAGAVEAPRCTRSAIAAGKWLLRMQRPDGSFTAMLLPRVGPRDPGGFHGDGSCIHAKNAIALLELHAMKGGEDFRDAAVKACEHALTLQASDGAFWSTHARQTVFTHAHCYACEGLLFAGSVLGDDRFLAAARRGIEWLARRQQVDGSLPSSCKGSLMSRRRLAEAIRRPRPTDAAAQAARLFRLAGPDYEKHRSAAIRFLVRCQDDGGGFPYHRTRFGYSPFLYTWAAQFAIQALEWSSGTARVEDLF